MQQISFTEGTRHEINQGSMLWLIHQYIPSARCLMSIKSICREILYEENKQTNKKHETGGSEYLFYPIQYIFLFITWPLI